MYLASIRKAAPSSQAARDGAAEPSQKSPQDSPHGICKAISPDAIPRASRRRKASARRAGAADRTFSALLAIILFTSLSYAVWVFRTSFGSDGEIGITEDNADSLILVEVCENSCPAAYSGTCDEGTGAASRVLCDLGTDCADCGAWAAKTTRRELPFLPSSFIASLTDKNVSAFVRRTVTDPAFLMPHADPNVDWDVSRQVKSTRGVELGITRVWHDILSKCCRWKAGRRGLVLDVGSNIGWYSLYAAVMGCRVIAWEPVPHFSALAKYGAHLNGVSHLIDFRNRVVAEDSGKLYDVLAPTRGMWGAAGIGGANLDPAALARGDYERFQVVGESLAEVVKENVCILKADVEGYETDVIESVQRLQKNYTIQNIFFNYSPGIWERSKNVDRMLQSPKMLLHLINRGYNLRHIPHRSAMNYAPGSLFHSPFEKWEVLTRQPILQDVKDVLAYGKYVMDCHQQEVKEEGGSACDGVDSHQHFHPDGFRSKFQHGTDIWAVKKNLDNYPGQQFQPGSRSNKQSRASDTHGGESGNGEDILSWLDFEQNGADIEVNERKST